jgi:hypothetical protein
MLFQSDQAVAPTDHEDLVEHFQEVKILGLARLFAEDGVFDLVNDLLEHVRGARDHEHAHRNTADDNEFRDMQKQYGIPAGDHETA